MTLIEQLLELGLAMRTRYPDGRRVGWTTDGAKAEAARELGARIVAHRSTEPRFFGWEVSCHELAEPAAALPLRGAESRSKDSGDQPPAPGAPRPGGAAQ